MKHGANTVKMFVLLFIIKKVFKLVLLRNDTVVSGVRCPNAY